MTALRDDMCGRPDQAGSAACLVEGGRSVCLDVVEAGALMAFGTDERRGVAGMHLFLCSGGTVARALKSGQLSQTTFDQPVDRMTALRGQPDRAGSTACLVGGG